VTATLNASEGATDVTSGALRFDVIKDLAASQLEISVDDVTDIVLAELFETSRETIWRFRKGRMGPRLKTAERMAQKLGTTVDAILAPSVVA
jgi:DNA-binding XRE family transcriptional regulator